MQVFHHVSKPVTMVIFLSQLRELLMSLKKVARFARIRTEPKISMVS